jgi:hypothetical protein
MDAVGYSSFVPWATMWMAFYPNTQEERHLKMATLLFDDVFFPVGHEHLIGAGAEFAREQKLRTDRITSAWHSIDSIDSSFTEPDFKAMLFKPPEELVFDKQGNWRRGLRGAVHTEVAKYFNVSPDRLRSQLKESKDPVQKYGIVREGNALANSSVGSAVVWTLIRPFRDCTFFPFNEVEFAAANLILGGTNAGRLKAANLLLPNAGDLTWQEVFEIRDTPEAESFRRWLHSREWVNIGNKTIEQDIIGALLEIVEDCRPNVGIEVLKGIASNIPLPLPINPASIALSLRAIGQAQQFTERYEWSLFLRQAVKSEK